MKSLLKKCLFISLFIHLFFLFFFLFNPFSWNFKKKKIFPIQIVDSKKLNQKEKKTVFHKKQEKKLKKLPKKIKPKKTKPQEISPPKKNPIPKHLHQEKKTSKKTNQESQNLKPILSGEQLKGLEKIEFLEYEKKIRLHIREHWHLPEWLNNQNLKTYVLIFINKKGAIIKKELILPSKNKLFDNSILNIIEKSSPLPPPPLNLQIFLSNGLILQFPK